MSNMHVGRCGRCFGETLDGKCQLLGCHNLYAEECAGCGLTYGDMMKTRGGFIWSRCAPNGCGRPLCGDCQYHEPPQELNTYGHHYCRDCAPNGSVTHAEAGRIMDNMRAAQ